VRARRGPASLAALAFAAAVTACSVDTDTEVVRRSEAPVVPRDFASGTRLRARVHVVGERVPVLAGFRDLVLGIECAFLDDDGQSLIPDGVAYCLPRTVSHVEGRGPYLDTACASPAALSPGASARGEEAPRYGRVVRDDACAAPPSLHELGPEVTRRAFVRSPSGACQVTTTQAMRPLAAEIPLSTFARAKEQVEAREGASEASRIGIRVLIGEDGSRVEIGGWDRERREASRVTRFADGTRRWATERLAFGGEQLDPGCSTPALTKIARTAVCPVGAGLLFEGSCGFGTFVELGPSAPLSYVGTPGACEANREGARAVFGVGAVIPPSSYAPVEEREIGERGESSGASAGDPGVRRRGYGVPGEPSAVWREVVDGATGQACEVRPARDGALRCLPVAAELVNRFADPACTEPAFSHPLNGCETEASFPRFVHAQLEEPPRGLEVLREIAITYAVTTDGRCGEVREPSAARAFAVREVPAARFPPAVLITE